MIEIKQGRLRIVIGKLFYLHVGYLLQWDRYGLAFGAFKEAAPKYPFHLWRISRTVLFHGWNHIQVIQP